MIRVSKYSGDGRGPGEELSKQGTACVGARRTGASRAWGGQGNRLWRRAHGCWKPSQDQRGFIRSDLHFKR